MKNVFILGSRGYRENYGGWETFVTNLVDNYQDPDTKFYISKITNQKEEDIVVNNNVIINPVCVKQENNLRMFIYSIKSLNKTLDYIKKNNIHDAYIYILGLKLLNYLSFKKHIFKKYNCHVIVNPDGLEWQRSKWNKLAKTFFKLSEKWMLNSSELIICDSLGIKEYVDGKYPKLSHKTKYIAYGYNSYKFDKKFEEDVLKEYNLLSNNYCLIVGRCVPENNLELIINEFMKSSIPKDLLIMSNFSSSNYFDYLKEKTNCLSDKRIKYLEGMYDPVKLAVIRKNAFLYFHGHSVGGTNPSLIESLSLTNLNILYDVSFNRYVARDSALYFKDENSLTTILNDSKNLDNISKEKGKLAKQIVKENFTWDIIIEKYKKIFK